MTKPAKQFRDFTKLTDVLLTAQREVVQKRIEQKREQAANNPRKRGPKRKASEPSADDHEGA